MLDFTKLLNQIDQVGTDSFIGTTLYETLENALSAFDKARLKTELFEHRLQENAGLVWWPLVKPLENINIQHKVEPWEAPVTVIGVDGSQIMPSHHEVHNCYLLNVGIALISYGVSLPPRLESIPHLYHKSEDLYPLVDRRRIHIDELYVSLERYILEVSTLAAAAVTAKERGLPVVALVDGSLIPWSVERMPDNYRATYLQRLSHNLKLFQNENIPLVGYLSHSRSSDLVNALRVFVCPFETSHCRKLCSHLNEEDFPCSKIWPLTDRQLFTERLPLYHRSSIFVSGASALRSLDSSQQICFTYLHIGSEVARLEFPRWLFDNKELLNFTTYVVLAQAKKGMGYPVCLAEAHHLAVIRGTDRERFFQLVTSHLAKLGLRQVKVSPKESKKRFGFV